MQHHYREVEIDHTYLSKMTKLICIMKRELEDINNKWS